jgi:hypothetical protein
VVDGERSVEELCAVCQRSKAVVCRRKKRLTSVVVLIHLLLTTISHRHHVHRSGMLICVVAKSFFPRRCRSHRCGRGFVQLLAVLQKYSELYQVAGGEHSGINGPEARRCDGSGRQM